MKQQVLGFMVVNSSHLSLCIISALWSTDADEGILNRLRLVHGNPYVLIMTHSTGTLTLNLNLRVRVRVRVGVRVTVSLS